MTKVPDIENSLMWFRRDLRLQDNNALAHASVASKNVYCIFVYDTKILNKLPKNDRRLSFIYDSLNEINEELKKKGSRLITLLGDPVEEIPKVAKKLKVEAVFANRDYESYAVNRDSKAARELKEDSISFYTFKDHVIFEKNEVLTNNRDYYKVFTPYKKQWLKVLKEDLPTEKKTDLKKIASFKGIPSSLEFIDFDKTGFNYQEDNLIKGGRKRALKLWRDFQKEGLKQYKQKRDYPALDNTSHLSPYLRFGNLSIRELVLDTYKSQSQSVQTWLSELVWRDFYQMILSAFPEVETKDFKEDYRKMKWPGKEEHFKLWKEGQTGFPLVDAAMRHFKDTGWMHNRLRMVVASFLTKDLLIDWRKGERYFAEKLLDYELGSNNGGWQWSASTGCDAQPYFRIFNPFTQSERFDPEGEFIKKYVPELKGFSKKYIHKPSEAPKDMQEEVGCIIGKDYPAPIVDHKEQRQKALSLFKEIKS